MQTKNLPPNDSLPSSFRDPSGIVFEKNGIIYRKVHPSYQDNYNLLLSSGLYEALIRDNLLIPHEEVKFKLIGKNKNLFIKPEIIPFISYPYE